jgi:CheY-like chemotaxis protein
MKTPLEIVEGDPGGTEAPFRGFHDLMRHRVRDILLVSSMYESFILAEDGQLTETLLSDFLDLNLHTIPNLTRVSTGKKALELATEHPRYNLIVATIDVADMTAVDLAHEVKKRGLEVPVVLLAFDNRELKDFLARHDVSVLDRVFVWQGDVRILLAIVKYVEDRWNVDHDSVLGGVQVILVVEDSIRYYSSFLPMIYTEVVKHSERLISEGINLSHRILRMRARPKILLCTSWEEAWSYFSRYHRNVLGIISDVEFPRGGEIRRTAGLELAREVKRAWPDLAVMLQSSRPENEKLAHEVDAEFVLKGSPNLLRNVRRFMVENFAFGDFIFRMPDGSEVGRAYDLKSLEEGLRSAPKESIAFHSERNHFSNWLKARTEFALAHKLRPRKVSDFPDLEALRRDLIESIAEYRRERHRGSIADFDPSTFDATDSFCRIGGGSLGGKARGLAFVRRLLERRWKPEESADVRVLVPPAVVLATDVFDEFLELNDLRDFAMECTDDEEIVRRFLQATFPRRIREQLAAYVDLVSYPLAVRSSSILEDSHYLPLTGVYETFMLANNHPDRSHRLARLLEAIQRVYASTFSHHTKGYLKATPYRLEEEKMGVIIQKIQGTARGDHYYPDFAGVVRSHNFYPTPPMEPGDGIVAVALGLGRTVVEGGNCVRFCPRFPKHLMPFSSLADALDNSQRTFWVLPLDGDDQLEEVSRSLDVAEREGTLAAVASTYCAQNDALYDGVSRPGVRVVTFAPILKHGAFPLAETIGRLMEIGERGMGHPVEIEFAVTLPSRPGEPGEFAFLQMRPLVLAQEGDELDLDEADPDELLCRSPNILGSGRIDEIRDLVVVDIHRFDRARSREAAEEVMRLNASLVSAGIPYLLVGVGRWGSTDPWLGIPVTWDEIAGARAIVEAGFKDFRVSPSQGTHFFQNLASFQVGYFTVNPEKGEGFVDWDWLARQPAFRDGTFARHLRFEDPILIEMSGSRNEGIIFKPGKRPNRSGNSSPFLE